MIVNKANPIFRAELKTAPGHPMGNRVLVRPHPIAGQTEGGLHKPDEAKQRHMAGVLIAVGDMAADSLYDLGVEVGDEVWYGRYAGLIEEWQHIVREGKGECTHLGVWEAVPKRTSSVTAEIVKHDPRWDGLNPHDENELRECRGCGALRLSERLLIMDKEDIVIDVDLRVRIERGEVERVRGKSADGKTRYGLIRHQAYVDTLEHRRAVA